MLVTSEKNFLLPPWSPWWLKGCPRLGLIPALCLCSVLGSGSWYVWLPKFSLENLWFPFQHFNVLPMLLMLCPLLRSMCSLIADLELAALDLCSASLFFFQLPAWFSNITRVTILASNVVNDTWLFLQCSFVLWWHQNFPERGQRFKWGVNF